MKGRFRKCIQLMLLAVFLVSTALFVRQLLDNAEGGETYSDAVQIALSGEKEETQAEPRETAGQKPGWIPAPVEEDDPNIAALSDMDLEALREVNPEVIGWILIPDTEIHYPLLQGEDNDFYLDHTWEGEENSVGAIFLEHRNTPDFTDFNTIVYGHNMNDGSMFAGLKRYSSQEYWEQHPYVYILTDQGVYRYEVFSSYQAPVDSSAYGLSFYQGETRVNFLVNALDNSKIKTGIQPELTDRILTLSTCSGAGYTNRWVVHARLRMVKEDG